MHNEYYGFWTIGDAIYRPVSLNYGEHYGSTYYAVLTDSM